MPLGSSVVDFASVDAYGSEAFIRLAEKPTKVLSVALLTDWEVRLREAVDQSLHDRGVDRTADEFHAAGFAGVWRLCIQLCHAAAHALDDAMGEQTEVKRSVLDRCLEAASNAAQFLDWQARLQQPPLQQQQAEKRTRATTLLDPTDSDPLLGATFSAVEKLLIASGRAVEIDNQNDAPSRDQVMGVAGLLAKLQRVLQWCRDVWQQGYRSREPGTCENPLQATYLAAADAVCRIASADHVWPGTAQAATAAGSGGILLRRQRKSKPPLASHADAWVEVALLCASIVGDMQEADSDPLANSVLVPSAAVLATLMTTDSLDSDSALIAKAPKVSAEVSGAEKLFRWPLPSAAFEEDAESTAATSAEGSVTTAAVQSSTLQGLMRMLRHSTNGNSNVPTTSTPSSEEVETRIKEAASRLLGQFASQACSVAAPAASQHLRRVTSTGDNDLGGAFSPHRVSRGGSRSPTPPRPLNVVALDGFACEAAETLLPIAVDVIELLERQSNERHEEAPQPSRAFGLLDNAVAAVAAAWLLAVAGESLPVRQRAELDVVVSHPSMARWVAAADRQLALLGSPASRGNKPATSGGSPAALDGASGQADGGGLLPSLRAASSTPNGPPPSFVVGVRRVVVSAFASCVTNDQRPGPRVSTPLGGAARGRLFARSQIPRPSSSEGPSPVPMHRIPERQASADATEPRTGLLNSQDASSALSLNSDTERTVGSRDATSGRSSPDDTALRSRTPVGRTDLAEDGQPMNSEEEAPRLGDSSSTGSGPAPGQQRPLLPDSGMMSPPHDASVATVPPQSPHDKGPESPVHAADVTVAAAVSADAASAAASDERDEGLPEMPVKPTASAPHVGSTDVAEEGPTLSSRLRAATAAVRESEELLSRTGTRNDDSLTASDDDDGDEGVEALAGHRADDDASDVELPTPVSPPVTPPEADLRSSNGFAANATDAAQAGYLPSTAQLAATLLPMYEELGFYKSETGEVLEKRKRFFIEPLVTSRRRGTSVDRMLKKMAIREIEKVTRHRDAVSATIDAIKLREVAVDTLHEFVALHERRPQHFNPGFCESHLTESLNTIGRLSGDVVNCINTWRDTLSSNDAQTEPFFYRGVNYVKKMQTDLVFIATSPLGAFLAVDVENNVVLAHRRRKIDRKVTEMDMRKRNFFARLAAPAGTLPVSRAAGSLSRRDADLIKLQRHAERERKTNSYFAAATAEVANLVLDDRTLQRQREAEKIPPSVVESNRKSTLMYRRKAGDRFLTACRPGSAPAGGRSSSQTALKRHASAALMAESTDTNFYLMGHGQQSDAAGEPIIDHNRMRVRNAMGATTMDAITMRCAGVESQGRHLWSVVYYICLMVGAKNRLKMIVRGRRSARCIQRVWRLFRRAKPLRYAGSDGTTPTRWRAVARNVLTESIIRANIAAIRIQRMLKVFLYRRAWRAIVRRYASLMRLQRWFREHPRTSVCRAGLRRAFAARRIQNWWRAIVAARAARMYRQQTDAATKIQCAWRCHAARGELNRRGAMLRAAKLVQRVARGFLGRLRARLVRRVMVVKRFLRANDSVLTCRANAARVYFATHIQCWVRRLWARVLRRRLADQRRRELRVFLRADASTVERVAATRIGSLFRGFRARRQFIHLVNDRRTTALAQFLRQERAPYAMVIQSAWRRFAAKIEVLRRRVQRTQRRHAFLVWQDLHQHTVAFRAQAAEVGRQRFNRLRQRIAAKKEADAQRQRRADGEQRRRQEGSAILLQSWYRRLAARRDWLEAQAYYAEIHRVEQEEAQQIDAVATLENAWVTHKRQRAARTLRRVRRDACARRLQRFARRSLARLHRVAALYDEHRRRVVAAVTIQRAWRVFLEFRDEREEEAALFASQQHVDDDQPCDGDDADGGSSGRRSASTGRLSGRVHFWELRSNVASSGERRRSSM